MSLGRFLDDLETGGSHGTRTKQELPANDRDPARNLSAKKLSQRAMDMPQREITRQSSSENGKFQTLYHTKTVPGYLDCPVISQCDTL